MGDIDYMLGTIIYCLLLRNKGIGLTGKVKMEGSRSFNLLVSSKNNDKGIQSARNLRRSSETICQLSKRDESTNSKFSSWLAGVIDGDGNFDIRNQGGKKVLKAIRIKIHDRDIRILTRIRDKLHVGRIRSEKNKPYSTYIVSTKWEMEKVVREINGKIRLKVESLKKACEFLEIDYKEPKYELEPLDPYLSGLIDTDGSIVFNYKANRIECNIELKYNEYSSKLCLDKVIPNNKPNVYFRKKKNQTPGRELKSIAFKYQTVGGMVPLKEYFIKNRLYSDMKFFRVMKIKEFLLLRNYGKELYETEEFKVYSKFLLKWVQYNNPKWTRVPYVKNLNINR